MAHYELVSTTSLGHINTFFRINVFEKILVSDSIKDCRGLAGTTKVRYNQVSAVEKG